MSYCIKHLFFNTVVLLTDTHTYCLYTHNGVGSILKSMLPVGFEPTISAVERPQTYALDRAATGTGQLDY